MDGLGVSDSTELDVSPEVVWDVLRHVGLYHKVFATCHRVDVYDRSSKTGKAILAEEASHDYVIQGGDRYKEYRIVEGRSFEFPTSVTQLEHYNNPAMKKTVESGDDNFDAESWVFGLATKLWQSHGTSTHVLTRIGADSCRLTISYGMSPMGCYGSLYLWLFRRRIAREGLISIRSDLQDISRAATLLQQQQQQQQELTTSQSNIDADNGPTNTMASKLPL